MLIEININYLHVQTSTLQLEDAKNAIFQSNVRAPVRKDSQYKYYASCKLQTYIRKARLSSCLFKLLLISFVRTDCYLSVHYLKKIMYIQV